MRSISQPDTPSTSTSPNSLIPNPLERAAGFGAAFKSRMRLPLLAMQLLIASAGVSHAAIFSAGETLRVDFKVGNVFTFALPDAMTFGFDGPIEVIQPYTKLNADLYDGANLLGHSEITDFGNYKGILYLAVAGSWRTADSLYTIFNPATIDFGPIQNNTIDGHLNFYISSGQINIPLNTIDMSLMSATSYNGGFYLGTTQISSAVIPEPFFDGVLSVAALSCLLFFRRNQEQRIGTESEWSVPVGPHLP